jgi:uncharacterized protein YcbX
VDVAPYLLVSETSLAAVSERLPADQPMDIMKFRPNIIVSGVDERWEEDYWGEVQFTSTVSDAPESVTLSLERNCVRCRSINVDYRTGQQGSDESGRVLALLQKDRRVDTGMKYNPVFGRYCFLSGAGGSISVGDEATMTRRNQHRAVFGNDLLSSNSDRMTNTTGRLESSISLGAKLTSGFGNCLLS